MRAQFKNPAMWPVGWPKTAWNMRRSDGKFVTRGGPVRFDTARDLLLDALSRLGARDVVLTHDDPANPTLRLWAPDAKAAVAVYFTLDGKSYAIPQDMFVTVAGNCRSVGIVVESMVTIKRHGGGAMMTKAFDGFTALPPPSPSSPARRRSRSWREVLDLDDVWIDRETVEAAFRARAKECHPDAGGTNEAMAELNAARDQALREVGS
jgi:hypothetical protein